MSSGISSCCTPCAAAPVVPQPAIEGGGPPSKDGTTGGGDVATTAPAPAPVAPEPTPEAGAQPAAPAEVTGGGERPEGTRDGGSTCYQPAPEPVQCGQWVPAPVATGPVAPTTPPSGPAPTSGPDTPPDPISGPGTDVNPAAPATTPATTLPTWPEWNQYFTRLGVSPAEIAKIGAANLNDQQLAQVYTNIHKSIVASGGVPGTTPIPAANAWNAEWEQKFNALGLPPEFVAEIKAEAMRTGADATKLEAVYQQVAAKGPQAAGTSAWDAEWEQKFAALGLPAEFVAELKATAAKNGADDKQLEAVYQQLVQQVGGPQGPQGQQPAADGPGWNPQVEQAFRSLGMPDEVIKLYAESGAPLSGLEAAYKHAAGRVEDFTKRGWMEKFTAAGVPPMQTWSAILGDQPVKDEDAEKLLAAHNKSQQSMLQKGGQLATSLFPGGRLLQFAFGKEFVSGEKIDRTDWKEIGFAALSGLALFATIRGARTIGQGWAARSGQYTQLNSLNKTLEGLTTTGGAKVPLGEVEAVSQAAMGATATWGFKQKLMSLIPGTALHKEIVGLGHAEAAARAFNNGGAAKILANDADGALQIASITKLFDDIKSGTTRIQGGALAYLGPFKKGPIMTLDAAKGGQEIIKVAKNLKIGNGNSQLVGLMEVAGTKLGKNPDWLTNAVNLSDDILALSAQQRQTLGAVMAGNLARDLGGFTKDGLRPMSYIKGLQVAHQPEWYANLANATKAQWPLAGAATMPQDLFAALSNHRMFTSMFDEAATAIAGIDRSALSPESAALLDDAVAQMDGARAGWDAAKAAGKLTDEVADAHMKWDASVAKLFDAEPELAKQVFANNIDEGAFRMAQTAAGDAVRSEWVAALPKVADEVAETVTANADEVAETVAANADEVAAATTHALPTTGAAVADDVVEGAAIATPTAAPTATVTGGGTGIGSNWQPGTQPRKFTGSVSEFIAEAQRPVPTPAAAPAATAPTAPAAASSPLTLTTNSRGEAVTGSGLIVPSYASPVTPFAGSGITDVNDPALARLADAMQRMRA